ncbi:hypothetical protein [Dysgonomonas sp. ZJ279]|uniref:hypothetical protein n=1 Tax=Dysgonomonas sp. ZJ279 TaxID=2709796 RepID=UPI0013ECF8AA|nr:hypothetical protein [Dysgonomonas sp. ZJ279]
MLLDHKSLKVQESNSKLSFTTTVGANWEVWDRYISYNNKHLFHIGNVCGTCQFFFSQLKTDLTASYTIEEVRDSLNSGLNKLDENLLQYLKDILPVGDYECLLLKIYPHQTCFNGKGDYFAEDQALLWNYGEEKSEQIGMTYYRGMDKIILDKEKLFEFFIPLYQPQSLNEDRVLFYQNQIKKGIQPTAISLSVVDTKESMIFDEESEDGVICHWGFANYLLDGHHKIQAAAREQKTITLISFISKDASFKVVNQLVDFYKQKKL